MADVAKNRAAFTQERIKVLQEELSNTAELKGKACVYVTGSFGRGEASRYSDLDLFIASDCEDGGSEELLTHLDEICVQADLIRVCRVLKFPDFSKDGKFLSRHSIHGLINKLGTEEDDVANTFTARLLLLLESKPLLEGEIYRKIVEQVIGGYWGDYKEHQANFMPAFLANDILRLWRTFCVNYEARTERSPPDKNAERKLAKYKLTHSRIITCFSALIFLLQVYNEKNSVAPDTALEMVMLTPRERLERVGRSNSDMASKVERALEHYARFLTFTDSEKSEQLEKFKNAQESDGLKQDANQFGQLIFAVLNTVAQTEDAKKFFRLMVV